jgi:localization factor PodJL
MQPDLPWNVAGIPPEAREAARAAARREGLSVGEWLTRRILRSFGDLGDQSTGRESWRSHPQPANGFGAPEDMPVSSITARDSQDMLDRVSRSENETQGAYRRIEDQLKGVGRRLEAAERSQTDNNRAMSKAATEINIAAREQAQAFDQLGTHVVSLNERLQRVERSSANDGLKDAVKALHQGLSRLADQIADTANQSAGQLASLAGNVETVAGQVSETRIQTEQTARTLDERLAAMDERVRAVERASYSSASTLERTVQTIEQSQATRRDGEGESHRQAAAITQLSETLDRLNSRFSASEAETSGAMARLEESVSKLELRNTDPGIDRRLTGIENALSDIAGRLETTERRNTGAHVEQDLRELAVRVDAADKRHRDALAELRATVNEANSHLEVEPPQPAPVVAAATVTAAPPPAFDLPPFPDAQPQPTFHAPPQVDAAPPPPVFDPAQFFTEQPQGTAFGADAFATNAAQQASTASQESFLAAARRSARAAATAEAEQGARGPLGGFSWGFARNATTAAPAEKPGSTRFVLIAGIILLVVIAIAAGVMLSHGANTTAAPQPGLNALLQPKPAEPGTTTAPDTSVPTSPSLTDNQAAAQLPAPPQTSVPQTAPSSPVIHKGVAHTTPVAVAPEPPVKAPAQQAAPAPAPQRPVSLSPMQRLTALANSGSAQGELLLGLAYLDGQGVAVNEAEAARWLERAANQGDPIAAYRLGTLYERGHGVPANAAKSVQLYMSAAKAGNRKAMHNLAVAYAQGAGVTKDYAQAAQWFTRAATLGLADSQFNLAVLYERGMGVPQSLKEAYKWYAIAAAQGDAESKARIDVLNSQISPDDKTAAQQAAQAFHPQTMNRNANIPPDASAVLGG